MKLIVDKAVTPSSHTKRIREALKEFKSRYTENDLLNAYLKFSNDDAGCNPEVLKCTVEGFYDPCNLERISFMIEIISYRNHFRFDIFQFFADINLNISPERCLRTHETFFQK